MDSEYLFVLHDGILFELSFSIAVIIKFERYSVVISTLQGMLLHERILMDRSYLPLHQYVCPMEALFDLNRYFKIKILIRIKG